MFGDPVEAAAVRRDRLQRDEASLAGSRGLLSGSLAAVLKTEHGPGLAPGELTQLGPLDGVAGRIPVVDVDRLGVRRAQKRRRILVEVGADPQLENGLLCGLAAQELR